MDGSEHSTVRFCFLLFSEIQFQVSKIQTEVALDWGNIRYASEAWQDTQCRKNQNEF